MSNVVQELQWNPGLTICQGNVKIISLNRDIVIADNDIVGKFHLGKRMLIVIPGISLYRRSLNRGSTVFTHAMGRPSATPQGTV